MVINITRWSPDTCGCVIDVSWDDSVPGEQRKTEHYATVEVCPIHESLATKTHSLDHKSRRDKKLAGVLDIIQERNVNRVIDQINKTKHAFHRRQLQQGHLAVQSHNRDVREEYDAIFSEPHVHDSHIYDIVLEENQRKNRVYTHLLENLQVDIHETGYHFAGEGDKRTLHPHIISLPKTELDKLHKEFDKTHGKGKVRIVTTIAGDDK